ncbi:jg12782 [Pararge aegeria aegeria]|uniref:Jg12782 protein n=1 Tax=Pararge aegeria aegeria TaxID=348720 RepID=A0A8S4RJF9_9NEOP|nr:jg12782 [Pararge aegeria aegeria]
MASLAFESLDEEVKELLLNYRYKKATAYEPCTLKNYKQCLIGLHEELGLFNIDYVFNPHTDVENDTLCPEALVKLINSVIDYTVCNLFFCCSTESYTPCADICDSTMVQLKERERKHRALISQLQASNQDLIREVLALKEEIILEGISNVKLKK